MVALAFTIVNIMSAKIRGKVPKIFGYSIMRIVSGSMEPELPIGTYILVKECDPKEIQPNKDVICFYSEDPSIYGFPNTHRVIEKIQAEDGSIKFITQGDANVIQDAFPVSSERVVGVYVRKLSLLSDFAKVLEGSGVIVLLILLQVAAFSMLAYIFVKKRTAPETEEDKKLPPEEK